MHPNPFRKNTSVEKPVPVRRVLVTSLLPLLLGITACALTSTADLPLPGLPVSTVEVEDIAEAKPDKDYAAPRPRIGLAFEESECFFAVPEGTDPLCGYLTVPEDHNNPAGRTIQIYLALFRAEGPGRASDPVIHLAGGPGGMGVDRLEYYYSQGFGRITDKRDYIMIDQRGVGNAIPDLDCDRDDSLRECHDRLADEGVDFSFYNAAQTAGDLAVLADTFGYEQINLYGVSYGTRVVQTALRDQPELIRAGILDAAYPLDVDFYTEWAPRAEEAFEQLFSGCAADSFCNAAYPDLRGTFFRVVDQLDRQPVEVTLTNPQTGDSNRFGVSGGHLINVTYRAMYFTDVIPLLPGAIAEIEQGRTDKLAEVYFRTEEAEISEGMYYAAFCREEIFFDSVDSIQAAAETVEPRLSQHFAGGLASRFELCDYWGAGEPDPFENEAVFSDTPTLIFSGVYDPIVPEAWSELVHETLTGSTLLIFPGSGHGVMRSDTCGLEIGLAFLDDPAGPLDTSCMGSVGEPTFVTN